MPVASPNLCFDLAFATYSLLLRRYIIEFAASKADVDAFCAARTRAGRPCLHQYSLALLGCSVQVRRQHFLL